MTDSQEQTERALWYSDRGTYYALRDANDRAEKAEAALEAAQARIGRLKTDLEEKAEYWAGQMSGMDADELSDMFSEMAAALEATDSGEG